ncbi:coproporphyrinogen III oxidase [Pseudomonas wadenswilerensis]|jgi:oxygen-independent coproporphyrinogen-3 oxidase|uniref:Oxygen-independent coproporphyrinogen III oxidase n=1 Tax=Pseudomonas wadenswilerensis TaxID=1785161 RepID=A0A380T0V7_9PSED|nr:coproporphyrinogen III oxidase [Pseudomonas]MCE5980924.1 coproporphyrinogen III oxidase [Pseudomonas sp. LF19]UVM24160.1 coproporphyrinogen III oxidase [Pseudomonas wadenswilerensis]SPO66467.1 Oxygen-independent coproporphyrinogen-III oxidase [Pseudomonas sp. JV241A]SUQ63605.1 Oxygen-independent coproporphyrinogen-III oxidase [Pseudomonas wadenswilerensis]
MLDSLHRHRQQITPHGQWPGEPGRHADTRRFHAGIGSLDVLRALRASRQQHRPLSLGVQLPAGLDSQEQDAYLRGLQREIALVGCHLGADQSIEQFQLSGATPGPEVLQQLMGQLRQRFNFLQHELGDYGVEVDLHHTDWATMGLLRDQGFNHVSIGVPDGGQGGVPSAARCQNPAPIHSLIDAARTFDFRSVSVDLGYGHAWQTPDSFARKLATLIELEPDRLQVFDYAQAPARYAHSARQAPCSEQDKALMRRICFEQLPAAGYQHIGLGQFVRADDDLAIAQERGRLRRNCQGFTRHGYCDHVGLGLGAISQFDELYAQNALSLAHYLQQLGNDQLATCRGWRCEADDQLRQRVTERLACDLELDIQAIEARYGVDFRQYFASAWRQLEAMSRAGLVELSARYISILPAGRVEVDAICQLFEQSSPGLSLHQQWVDHDASL